MAAIDVVQSAANADSRSLIYQLTVLVNQQAAAIDALTAKLDADAGVTDTNYASTIGAMDTLTFRGVAPS